MRTFFRALRTLSVITLFFFCWTFLPLWQAVAYATEKQKSGASSQKPGEMQKTEPRVQGPGERFEKALEGIREHIHKAEEKSSKGIEPSDEVATIKTKKAELETIDSELKTEFAATEKKLKDANLPSEILDRHHKFVKHYQDNLKELVGNLEKVEKAKTRAEVNKTVKKAKLHLEKTKAPKRHKALDPNNLPHRTVKAKKEKTPRLKKEDFERDFPKKKHKNLAADFMRSAHVFETSSNNSAFRNPKSAIEHKPIMLAYSGDISDLQLPSASTHPRLNAFTQERHSSAIEFALNSQLHTMNYQIAQAMDAPSADDLSETPEIQFTPEIRALAAQLDHNPVKIYNWVRNNIEFVPTYGSIQGAQMTLETKMGNAFDTASLLIALLRASNIYAHYVYGTIEIPIEKAMNWVGGVTDPKMVGTILSTNGIPAKMLISGGTYKTVQLEHVWVDAFVDYIPSRGAVQRQGNTWIPLDASYKQYNYTQGIDIQTAVPFDAQAFANQIQSTATINPDGSVTNVNSALIQQTMQDYQTRVQNYITQNNPNATVGDVLGKKEIVKQEFPYLMGTLPYKATQIGAEFATVPSSYRATMSFNIPDQTGMGDGLSYSTSLPQIAGKKITVSFSPATAADQAAIDSYLPKAHPDGSPIQPNELPSSLPAYLIKLKPELRIDGQVVATGSAVTMGSAQPFTMSLNEPGFGVSNIDNTVQAGEYLGIGLDTGKIGAAYIEKLKSKLQTTKAKLDTKNFDGISKDDLVGDLLYSSIADYFAELDSADEILSKTLNIVRHRAPSLGRFSLALNVSELFGTPNNVSCVGVMMDVDHIVQSVFSKDGNIDKIRPYMLVSGHISSALESAVIEKLYSQANSPVKAVSAVKALQIANEHGVPIYAINKLNISSILPLLQVGVDVQADIVNAVSAGKEVVVSKTNVTINGWIGCGYIILDPITGAGAYMISNSLSGGSANLVAGAAFMIICGLILQLGAALLIGAPIIGAVIIGLSIGLFLSQVLSSESKAQLKLLISFESCNLLERVAALGVFFPVAALVAVVAALILKLLETFELISTNNIRRRYADELFAKRNIAAAGSS